MIDDMIDLKIQPINPGDQWKWKIKKVKNR